MRGSRALSPPCVRTLLLLLLRCLLACWLRLCCCLLACWLRLCCCLFACWLRLYCCCLLLLLLVFCFFRFFFNGSTRRRCVLVSSMLYVMSIVGYLSMAWFSKMYGLRWSLVVVMIMNGLACVLAIVADGHAAVIVTGRAISGFAVTSLLTQTWMNFAGGDAQAVVTQA